MTSAPWEEGRNSDQAQRYLKRIRYGNQVMHEATDFTFEVVFGYGEHGNVPAFDVEEAADLAISATELGDWPARPDTFSSFRAGFDVRTRRLCQRILMFHRFSELGSEDPVLVASTDLTYDANPIAAQLRAITRRSYVHDAETGLYQAAALPPLEMIYQQPELGEAIREVAASALADLGSGIDGSRIRLTDLDGEGIPGVLVAEPGGWQYKEPRLPQDDGAPCWGRARTLNTMPTTGVQAARLMDLEGDGQLSLVDFDGPRCYPRAQRDWQSPRRLETFMSRALEHERVHTTDVDGDGLTDFLVDEGDHFTWYRACGQAGFAPGIRVPKPSDDHQAPQLVYGSPQAAVFLADMTGDSLADIVRIDHGSVAYWPNLGYGRFGHRIRMGSVGQLDRQESFRADRVRLGDIDGSGTSDLIYLGRTATVRLNQAGNSFAPPHQLRQFPSLTTISHADLVDLTGSGTADLVWSSSGPRDRQRKLRYIDLMPGGKPYLLAEVRNNLGLETRVRYRPSTHFYLQDKGLGRPWLSPLPFPVQVVERVEVLDRVRGHRMVSTYAYRHGYFDGAEREFRGFGMVEQRDAESFEHFGEPGLFADGYQVIDHELHKPPVLTRTWFHTGTYVGHGALAKQYEGEYWSGDAQAWRLPDTVLPLGLTSDETLEAARALRGRVLREEVVALDGTEQEPHPYTVVERSHVVRLMQPKGEGQHAVVFAHNGQTLTYHYERNPDDPRIGHELVLDVDDYGSVTRSVTIGYPRRVPEYPEQGVRTVVVGEASFTAVDAAENQPGVYRANMPVESWSFEALGLPETLEDVPGATRPPVQPDALRTVLDAAVQVAPDDAAVPPEGTVHLRLLSANRTLYWADDLSGPLPLGQCGTRGLVHETQAAAMSDGQVQAAYGADVDGSLLAEVGYVAAEGLWWSRSPHQQLDPMRFWVPTSVTDPFSGTTVITWDPYTLFVTTLQNPVGNLITAEHDYRVLSPWRITDPNGNRTAVGFDTRGLVVWTAVMGKEGAGEGDTEDDPTTILAYDPFAWRDRGEPVSSHVRSRETHGDPGTRWIHAYTYSDGFGGVLLEKQSAAPGLAPQRDANGALILDEAGAPVLAPATPRWVGTGRVVLDNKGNPVRHYEPYFSSTEAYEAEAELREQGVTPVIY